MSPETCTRVRDAAWRVWGDAVLMEHAKVCEACGREFEVMKRRREFRDAFPVLTSIADESERAPTRARANADDARRQAAQRRHLFLMIAAVVVIIGFVARNSVLRDPATAPASGEGGATDRPFFRISNLENALFESKVEGGTVKSSMTRGVAAFHVERLGAGQRFLLTLPDAELEVRGTRFVVTIAGGKTQGIEVSEGEVALRPQGQPEVLLSAGDRWPAESHRPAVSFLNIAPRKDAAPPEPSKPKD